MLEILNCKICFQCFRIFKEKIALSEQNVLSYSEVWYKTSVFDVVEQNLGMYTNL